MTANTPNQNTTDLIRLRGVLSQKIDALLDKRDPRAAPLMEARGYINRAIESLQYGTTQRELDAAGAYLDRAKAILKGVA